MRFIGAPEEDGPSAIEGLLFDEQRRIAQPSHMMMKGADRRRQATLIGARPCSSSVAAARAG